MMFFYLLIFLVLVVFTSFLINAYTKIDGKTIVTVILATFMLFVSFTTIYFLVSFALYGVYPYPYHEDGLIFHFMYHGLGTLFSTVLFTTLLSYASDDDDDT